MINEKEILSVEGEEQNYNKNTILNIKSPCLLKLTFRKNELINLEQID